MARYTGPVCRLCRREGEKLFLKGEKCYTEKCPVDRRAYPPGQHGQGRRQRLSEYGMHLREKQKLRRIYGVLERQFRRYYQEAARRKGVTGENLLQLLGVPAGQRGLPAGLRAVRRCGPAAGDARSLHGERAEGGYPVGVGKVGDVIAVRERSRNIAMIKESVQAAQSRGVPDWLELDADGLNGTVKSLPTPRADRRPRAGAPHRRALLPVVHDVSETGARDDAGRAFAVSCSSRQGGFRTMIEIQKPKIETEEMTETYGRFVVEPLERGYGITLGNSLQAHPALVPSGRGGDVGPHRRRAARVFHD